MAAEQAKAKGFKVSAVFKEPCRSASEKPYPDLPLGNISVHVS